MRQLLRLLIQLNLQIENGDLKGAPNKGKIPNDSDFTLAMKNEDYKNFQDGFKPIDKKSIWDYYAVKTLTIFKSVVTVCIICLQILQTYQYHNLM